jgi:glyoxylase-like metal-dependent hydrolase (beta-lactamase superfamily II)
MNRSATKTQIIHEILPVGVLQCNCSIIGDTANGECMVIDPGAEVERIAEIIEQHNLKVKQIVITHGHIDHVAGAMRLKQLTGAPILMNKNDNEQLKLLDIQAAWIGLTAPGKVQIDASIGSGDVVKAGGLEASVMHTPGHTEGSSCLYFEREKKLIAGDTLFAGSIGRTDLPGGDFKKILDSLHNLVLSLPDDTQVIPGHGPLTSIGRERETNPFLVSK